MHLSFKGQSDSLVVVAQLVAAVVAAGIECSSSELVLAVVYLEAVIVHSYNHLAVEVGRHNPSAEAVAVGVVDASMFEE